MKADAVYTIKAVGAKELYKCLLLEEEGCDSMSDRSDISLEFKEPETLIISINSRDTTSLRAATNTWLRLANTGLEIYEILNK
ncbi:MAG: hypothetical protein GX362_05660 [Methanosarcinaceae archaeon]|nr:hypothetical protein [Methanosarcinaceae archaeon]